MKKYILIKIIQVLSLAGAIATAIILWKNVGTSVTVTFPHLECDIAIFALFWVVIGVLLGMGLVYKDVLRNEDRISALTREGEKKSISSTEGEAKIKVLENKIATLEIALKNALEK